MAKHRISDEDSAAANAGAASILEAAGRSEAGRQYLRTLDPATREAAYSMAAEHREAVARR